jgi:23S rRNA pseudouridine1911/1915/1917 synthase
MKIKYEGQGDRLDIFLSDYIEELSRSKVQELIKTNKVLVNGEVKKQKHILSPGDILEVEISFEQKAVKE